MPLDAYRKDLFRRKGTERLLQELIEAAIDINTHLIIQMGHDAPKDDDQSFTKLRGIGVIPQELAEKLAPSAGLRNRRVHRHEELEDTRILEGVEMAQALYPLYLHPGH
jgi:uncharacterized protein YutE (UPF0331/DUF86 family)